VWHMKLSFNKVFVDPQRTPIVWVAPRFTPTLQSAQIWFQTVQCLMFLPYLLVQVFKFIDLGGIGIGTWWSFWF
jgi:hypothetical protein